MVILAGTFIKAHKRVIGHKERYLEYLLVPSSTGPLGGTRKWAPPPREGSHLNAPVSVSGH